MRVIVRAGECHETIRGSETSGESRRAAQEKIRTTNPAVLLRVGGTRNLAQLNSFDLIVVLVLSNVVQNAILGPVNSLTGGLLGAVVLLAVNAVVVRLVNRSDRAVQLFEGDHVSLVKNGKYIDRALRPEGLHRADVEARLAAIERALSGRGH
jgi:hypothetical protein